MSVTPAPAALGHLVAVEHADPGPGRLGMFSTRLAHSVN